MELIFTDQYAELFLLLNGLAVLFYVGAIQQKRKRAIKFGNYDTLQKVAGKSFLKSSNIVLGLRLAGLSALLIGISNPVLVQEAPTADSDYVLAIDSSSSMLSEDFDPNRFRAAKDLSTNFIQSLPDGTSVGVISFAGKARIEQNPTIDKSKAVTATKNIKLGEEAGTAIGDAIISSVSMMIDSEKNRSVILVTDGVNNIGSSINESTVYSRNNNASVYTIGIGNSKNETPSSTIINATNATAAEFPNLDTKELKKIAENTGGEFIAVRTNKGLEKALSDISRSEKRTDLSKPIIILAAIILLIEWVLGSTRYSVIP